MSDATSESASSAAAAKRAARAEAQRRRRQNPEVRAAEAEAKRRRRQDPGVRAAEAQAHRRRREDPEVRAAEAEAKRRRREGPGVHAAEAEAHRRRREDPTVRTAEAEAKRYARLADSEGATKTFQRQFRDNPLGSVCSMCDRLFFQNDLKPLPDRCHKTLQRAFPNSDLCQFRLCFTCVGSVQKGNIPQLSISNCPKYPPKRAHLPQLNVNGRKELACVCRKKSMKLVQTETLGPFNATVDIAVETPRNVDACMQTSFVAVKVHRYMQATDGENFEDSDNPV